MQNNYITIQGWMITDLKLSGNQLLLFALIFGFCQDGKSKFTGSINYVCDWLGCTRPTAIKALQVLQEKGLIEKQQEKRNNVTFNSYKMGSKEILLVVKKFNGGSKETLLGGSKETLPNNTNIDIYKDTIAKSFENYKNWTKAQFQKKAFDLNKEKRILSDSQLLEFAEYWLELTSKGKHRFTTMDAWDMSRRMRTWKKKDDSFKGNDSKITHKWL